MWLSRFGTPRDPNIYCWVYSPPFLYRWGSTCHLLAVHFVGNRATKASSHILTHTRQGENPSVITHNPLQPRLPAKSLRTEDHGSSKKGQGKQETSWAIINTHTEKVILPRHWSQPYCHIHQLSCRPFPLYLSLSPSVYHFPSVLNFCLSPFPTPPPCHHLLSLISLSLISLLQYFYVSPLSLSTH